MPWGRDKPAAPVFADSKLLSSRSSFFASALSGEFAEVTVERLERPPDSIKFPDSDCDDEDGEDEGGEDDDGVDEDGEDEPLAETNEEGASEQTESETAGEGTSGRGDAASDASSPLTSLDSSSDGGERGPKMRRIMIRDFYRPTVLAFVHYLLTGEIEFAPLSCLPDEARDMAIASFSSTFPERVPPVSAQSIYRMADKCACEFGASLTAQVRLPGSRRAGPRPHQVGAAD